MIRIQVPATSANLGSGFDSLGIALTLYNQVWMEESDTLDISSKDSIQIPTLLRIEEEIDNNAVYGYKRIK